MANKCVIDFRMRKIEKEYIKSLGYEIIENNFNKYVYDEISAHVDIYFLKMDNMVFCSPEKRNILPVKCIVGKTFIESKYPKDIAYNVCIIGRNALHNFKYTDIEVRRYLEKHGYDCINVEQGYSACSTFVIDEACCITSDIGMEKKLKEKHIDVLYVIEPNIRLLTRRNNTVNEEGKMKFKYSSMPGFIGGAMAKFNNEVVLFGDMETLINGNKIKEYIESLGFKFKDFKGLDVIDYGGILKINGNE